MRRTLAILAVLTFICVGVSACGKHGKHDNDSDPVAAYGVDPPAPDPLKVAPPVTAPETPMTSNQVSASALEPKADAVRPPLPVINPSSLTASPSDSSPSPP
jgi:hypothetical protein